MPQQVTPRLPDPVVDAPDTAARQLCRSRAEVIRLAVEHDLEDFDDLSVAIDRLRDSSDPVLDWDQVRRQLLDTDQGKRGQGAEACRQAGPDAHRRRHRPPETPHLGSPLKGVLRGLRRLRVGDYRVAYEIRDDEVVVLVVRVAYRRTGS